MPIAVKVVPQDEYDVWHASQIEPAPQESQIKTETKEDTNG